MLEPYLQQLIIIKKINRFKIKITEKWCCLDENALSFTAQYCLSLLGNTHGFHLCNVFPRVLGNIEQNFLLCIDVWTLKEIIAFCVYLCNVVSGVLRQHWTGFFSMHCCLEPRWQHFIGYLPVQCYPSRTKTTLNKIFPVQRCLEPLGQHCTRFLLMLCCPKSIEITLIRDFSCAMLSGASWTTFRKVFTCLMWTHG